MIYIIGSGPAGVSAAKALLARNISVTMIDVGIQLDENKVKSLDQYKQNRQSDTFRNLKHHINGTNNIKLSYGSDYVYRGVTEFINFRCSEEVCCTPSFARGGLSNVWGACVMPYTEVELKNWPFSSDYLSKYYKKIFEYVPLSVGLCDYPEKRPLYTNHFSLYQHSEQAKKILQIMKKNADELNANEIEFGSTRLAVHFTFEGKKECSYCGLCQHGCPDQLIYSASHTLNELIQDKNFNYIENVVVSHFVENQNSVTIYANHFLNNEPVLFQASKIFLAAGVISTTKILLASLQLYNMPVRLKDSQHFMIPAITYQSTKNTKKEKLHTLAQLYIKLNNKQLLTNPAYLQVYTYMDHYESKFKQLLKFAYPLFKWFLTPILNRLIVLQGFLDSEDSPVCEISLAEDNKTITLNGRKNESIKKIKWIKKYLFKNRKQLGFVQFPFLSGISNILRSYHYGGTFPMSKSESKITTDFLGRPFKSKRVHVVDATIFPSIPADTITLAIMANAYRIASECNLYE